MFLFSRRTKKKTELEQELTMLKIRHENLEKKVGVLTKKLGMVSVYNINTGVEFYTNEEYAAFDKREGLPPTRWRDVNKP